MPIPTRSTSPLVRVRAFAPEPSAPPDRAELLIYGRIGESWSDESVLAQSVVEQLIALPATVAEIHVRLNSEGGSCVGGLAIYNALAAHPARIIVTVDGIAASIASFIAMAGEEVRMHPTSMLMIHAPWCSAGGNAVELRQYIDQLNMWAATMAKGYAAKSGRTEAECFALLTDGADHWFNADEAVAAGFADTVIGTQTAAPVPETTPADEATFAQSVRQLSQRAPLQIAASLRTLSLRGFTMPGNTNTTGAVSAEDILAAERNRRAEIRAMAPAFDPSTAKGMEIRAELDRALDDPQCSTGDFGKRILALMARDAEPLSGGAFVRAGGTHGNRGDFVMAAADAIAMRAGVSVSDPNPAARDLRGMSIAELARACLSRAGKRFDFGNNGAMIKAALSTSDFPQILGDSLGKMLRTGFEAEPKTHEIWTRLVKVTDFREQKRPILGSAPDLLPVAEGAEYKFGSLDEDRAVPYKVGKFGRLIKLTWEALINDDLGAFSRMTAALGQAAARAEADQVYQPFGENSGAGPEMQDGVNLFHAAHGNLASSATTLDAAALGAARVLLRRQTAVGGGQLNLVPRFLLVAPEHEQAAETLLAASARSMSQGTANGLVPAWLAGLTLVVEARLPGSAAYLLAGAAQIDTVERAWLEADNGPVIVEDEGFATDDRTYKVRHVFGARWLDWRGVVKLPIGGG